jgi:hypothetical protein
MKFPVSEKNHPSPNEIPDIQKNHSLSDENQKNPKS